MKFFKSVFILILFALIMPLLVGAQCGGNICKAHNEMTFYSGSSLEFKSGATFTNAGTTALSGALSVAAEASFNADVTVGDAQTDIFTIASGSLAITNTTGLFISTFTSATNPIMFFDVANQRVGIGTDSPASIFEVVGTITGDDMSLSGTATAVDLVGDDITITYGISAATAVFSSTVDVAKLTSDIIIDVVDTSYSALEASSDITCTSSFFVINGTGTISLTSTPTVSTLTATNGQYMEIMGGSNAVTFQDNGTLSDSLLELGDNGRALAAGDILRIRFYDGKWYESSFVNN